MDNFDKARKLMRNRIIVYNVYFTLIYFCMWITTVILSCYCLPMWVLMYFTSEGIPKYVDELYDIVSFRNYKDEIMDKDSFTCLFYCKKCKEKGIKWFSRNEINNLSENTFNELFVKKQCFKCLKEK